MKKTILIGVSSGIAAYKVLDLITLLKKDGYDVFVIMTQSATNMVSIKDFEKVSGHNVSVHLFEQGFDYKNILKTRQVEHIELADKADVFVIAPATANTIAKLAHGIADDFLTTTALAVTAPILLCPSMNVNMWHNPVVQENIALLKKRGFQIINPASGMLACGYEGEGRLADIEMIKEEIIHLLNRSSTLKGRRIIVTAGGTVEKIDEVRYITNRSSGKMGIALAEVCYERGAQVTLLRATTSIKPRYTQIQQKYFETVDELLALIKNEVTDCDIIFHVAAVSDFEVESNTKALSLGSSNDFSSHRAKKNITTRVEAIGKIPSDKPIYLTLKPRPKILDMLKKLNRALHIVAFKAEYGLKESALAKIARERLYKSQADMIIANDISQKDRGFEADTNEVLILMKDGTQKKISLRTKREVATEIVEVMIRALHS